MDEILGQQVPQEQKPANDQADSGSSYNKGTAVGLGIVTGLALAAGGASNPNATPVHAVGPDGPMIEQFGGHPSQPTNHVAEVGTGKIGGNIITQRS